MPLPDLAPAVSALTEAELAERPADRFLGAHLAALRVAAVVLACRTRSGRRAPATRPRDVWQLLADVAPEYAEWSGFFAASALKRQAVQAGAVALVSAREADDLVRDVRLFLDQVARRFARPAAPAAEPSVVEGGSVKGRIPRADARSTLRADWHPLDSTLRVERAWPSRKLATEIGCPEPSSAPPPTPGASSKRSVAS